MLERLREAVRESCERRRLCEIRAHPTLTIATHLDEIDPLVSRELPLRPRPMGAHSRPLILLCHRLLDVSRDFAVDPAGGAVCRRREPSQTASA